MLVSSVSPFINNKSVYASEAETTDTAIKELTYEESQNLPLANILKDTNTDLYGPQSRGISLYSVSNPSSITDYKNLGYKNIYYTGWTGDKIVMSTKSVRITTFVATNILGFIPSRLVSAAIALYPRFPKNYNVVGGTTPKVLYNCDCFFVTSPTRNALPGFSNASMTSNSSSSSCIV